MMSYPILQLQGAIDRRIDYRLLHPVDFALLPGEHIAVLGPTGSGKSLFADLLTAAHPAAGHSVRRITFRDAYGDYRPAYYQQRWNRGDAPPCPVVGDLVTDTDALRPLGLALLMNRRIDSLSSGELRRYHLARVLASHPTVLIVEEPFIGLDAEGRDAFVTVLTALSRSMSIIISVTRREDIPPFITHVVPVNAFRVGDKSAVNGVCYINEGVGEKFFTTSSLDESSRITSPVIQLHDVTVRYAGRHLLHHLTWNVERGECWAVTGPNGAGKSTLLSLVCADNPQAYSLDICLFGSRRGRGESIWDIKRRIGFTSPELLSTYLQPLPALHIVASGLRDTIGLYGRPREEELAAARRWMCAAGVEALAEREFTRLSSGEMRIVLLLRAMVKEPELLVLDEPFHGLDPDRRDAMRTLVDDYIARTGATLVFVSHIEADFPTCIHRQLMLR